MILHKLKTELHVTCESDPVKDVQLILTWVISVLNLGVKYLYNTQYHITCRYSLSLFLNFTLGPILEIKTLRLPDSSRLRKLSLSIPSSEIKNIFRLNFVGFYKHSHIENIKDLVLLCCNLFLPSNLWINSLRPHSVNLSRTKSDVSMEFHCKSGKHGIII